MPRLTNVQLTAFEAEVERRRVAALRRADSLPIATLIWGPAPKTNTAVGRTREALRTALTDKGHLVRYSEDLIDRKSKKSLLMQQLAQVEAYDVVFSIPDSPGSIAEIHDFARIPEISHKIVAFLNRKWNGGYANKSLTQLQTPVTCQVQLYTSKHLPRAVVVPALELVGRLQEVFYTTGRRRL